MGWADGSEVMCGIIRVAKEYVPESTRKSFYLRVIGVLEDADWDTEDEAMGIDPLFDEALKEAHPDWDWE